MLAYNSLENEQIWNCHTQISHYFNLMWLGVYRTKQTIQFFFLISFFIHNLCKSQLSFLIGSIQFCAHIYSATHVPFLYLVCSVYFSWNMQQLWSCLDVGVAVWTRIAREESHSKQCIPTSRVVLFFWFLRQGFLCSPSSLWTCSVEQASFQFRDPTASATWVFRLKAYASTPG